MGTLGGIAVVVAIVFVAGLIAYVGDRVGHKVGRRRMTLFGLRPKYTSTIVAIATGMMIALVVTLTALAASGYARAAFFHLGEINNRVNELQAQADDLTKRVRESNVVANRGDLLYDQFLLLSPGASQADRQRELAAFFDAVVVSVNRRLVPQGLKTYRERSSDPVIAAKLASVLSDARVQGFSLRGPVLLVAIADENLFVNDKIEFTFAPYSDVMIFRARQAIASIELDGGTPVNPNVAYNQLAAAIEQDATLAGMPVYFARPVITVTEREAEAVREAVRSGKGRFYLVARAAVDVYPHTGGVPVAFELSRQPR